MNRTLVASLLLIHLLAFAGLAFGLMPHRTAASAEIRWLSMEEAYALNQKAPRKIFVDVYTSWCGWCKRMDKDTFSHSDVAAYVNEHYYAVKLNAESDRSFKLGQAEMTDRQVARQLGVSGYPTIVLIHEDFRTIEPVPGYKQPDQFMQLLKSFAAKTIK